MRHETSRPAAASLLVLVAAISVIAACTRYDVAQLRGDWRAEYPFGTETLTLRADGRYEQRFVLKSTGEVTTRSGKWEYDTRDGRLVVHDCMDVVEDFVKLRQDYKTSKVTSVMMPEREHLFYGRLVLGSEEYPLRKQ